MPKNAAGGFAFNLGDRARLDRFLVLGTDVGTYHTEERPLTIELKDANLEDVKVIPDELPVPVKVVVGRRPA
ncbi:MAG: hypothetical protein WD627_00610 [Actinomycetota bacterium]